MAKEYRGDDFLYLVNIEGDLEDGGAEHRIFNQTDGSSSIEADAIELDTKDRTGSDYGSVSESLSVEGVLTQDDPAIKYIRAAIRGKKFVKITEVNTRTLETQEGSYKLDSFEQSNANGEFATYSIEATLTGDITEGELELVPEGATGDGVVA